MRDRKLVIFIALLLALVAGFVFTESRPSSAALAAAATREEARRQGFKLDPAEFDALSSEDVARAAAFAAARTRLQNQPSYGDREWHLETQDWNNSPDARLLTDDHVGAMMRVILEDRPLRFAPARGNTPWATLGGIYVNAWGEWTDGMLLKTLAKTFAARTYVALNDRRHDEAWTNLLALNALAARYRPGPFAGAHHVATRLVQAAFRLDSEALRMHPWSDSRLEELERIWRSARVLDGLDEVPMGTGANLVSITAAARDASRTGNSATPSDMFEMTMNSSGSLPRSLRAMLDGYTMRRDFARRISYLNESELIRFHRQRIELFRSALRCATWRDMSAMAALTKPPRPDLTSNFMSPPLLGLGSPDRSLATLTYDDTVEPFTARIEAETRRRILLVALAVERARLRLGHIPGTLAGAGDVPDDFMNGEPLHYRPEADGTYKIYSVGFDLTDDGGQTFTWYGPDHGSKGDIVWPRLLHDDAPDSDATR